MEKDFADPERKVTCTFCGKIKINTRLWVVVIDGKTFCKNRNRCYNAYIRNGRKPKPLRAKPIKKSFYSR